MKRNFLALAAALLLSFGSVAVAGAQDVTDPITTAVLPTDQIIVNRNVHQRLAGPISLLFPAQAGSCAMVSATTCTVTVTNAYTSAPICIAQDKTGFIVAHATGPVSSATITVTAASSQSDTFNVVCHGNPS